MTSYQNRKDISTILLYVFGFLLLWEWLQPLEQLTNMGNTFVFILFLVVSFTLAFFNVPFLISALIKTVYMVYSLHFLYFEGSFFDLGWFPVFTSDLMMNLSAIFLSDWGGLSDMFRSLLFFALLWSMSYLIQYWLINRKQILLFLFMTLIYISVLDTFTPYEADFAIVRIVIAGFILMGMLTFNRIVDREKVEKQASFSRKWMVPLVIMVGISVIFGYVAPKADPIWPDPVPFIQSFSEESGSGDGKVKTVGYGTDDSRLGGPFLGDDQLVYITETDTSHYWRIETKDIYTGKGWEASFEDEYHPFTQAESVPFSNLAGGNIETEEQVDSVRSLKDYPHIIYPVGLKSIEAYVGYTFEADLGLEKIYSLQASRTTAVNEYSLIYDSPKYSVKAMMAATDESRQLEGEENFSRYTQLPDNLPQRVKDLASEITEGKETWFDKARAIENYFDRPEFFYDQTNVAIPRFDEDYVDQFLFETNRGYCDNFSTSMVVLTRSVGIPARWVKGYTEGEMKGNAESGQKIYHITNNNAHSWVEVYFPEVGWVPFEPTKGFSNNVQFNYDQFSDDHNTEPETVEEEEPPEVEKPEQKEQTAEEAAASFSLEKAREKVNKFFNKNWRSILLASLFIGLAAGIFYKMRLKWLPYYWLFRFKWRKKDEDFPAAYIVLLKQLDRYGLKRSPDQTLREYAQSVDEYFSSSEMSTLTSLYEQYLYKNHLEDGCWEEMRELWKNTIKQTIA